MIQGGGAPPPKPRENEPEEVLRAKYLDYCSAQVADILLLLSPDEMFVLAQDAAPKVVDLLVHAGLVASKSQARRLIAQGGVRLSGAKIESLDQLVDGTETQVLQVGKRKFIQITRE